MDSRTSLLQSMAGLILLMAAIPAVGECEDVNSATLLDNLTLQLSEDFSEQVGTPDPVDASRWTRLTAYDGEFGFEGGHGVIKAATSAKAGPGVFVFGGFTPKGKLLNPGLQGTNYVEICLADYTNDGDYLCKWLDMYGNPSLMEDPTMGRYVMGWSLMIGSFTGQIGRESDPKVDRAVQLWFDWMEKRGLHIALGRNVIPGDTDRFPVWDPKKVSVDEIIKKPFIAHPCLALATKHYPRGTLVPIAHRYGIGLAGDGNRLFWTLDGKVMGIHDITGFFSSSPGVMKDSAYVSIVAGSGYRSNVWKFDNMRVYVSK